MEQNSLFRTISQKNIASAFKKAFCRKNSWTWGTRLFSLFQSQNSYEKNFDKKISPTTFLQKKATSISKGGVARFLAEDFYEIQKWENLSYYIEITKCKLCW